MSMKLAVLWSVQPRNAVDINRRFRDNLIMYAVRTSEMS